MFNHLVESETHAADLKRRGSFVFGTMLVYALLFAAAAVASIYAYEAQVDRQNLELTSLVTMVPLAPAAPPRPMQHPDGPQPHPSTNNAQVPVRTMSQTSVEDMRRVPTGVATTGNNVPPMLPGSRIGPVNIDPGGDGSAPFSNGGPGSTGTGIGPTGGRNEILKDEPPEPSKVTSQPPKQRPNIVRSLGVIESKVISKAVPPYPELAKRMGISGTVTVQILLDEQGHVISARATDGHPLLRPAAERAAYQTKFSPTLLSNQPVKVSGVITFSFILR